MSLLTVRVEKWRTLLCKAAYSAAETDKLCAMLTDGARAGVQPSPEGRLVVRRHVQNLASASENEGVVDAYMVREVDTLGRVLRLGTDLPSQWLEPYVSPLGVIPKARTGKFRMINNLSSGGRWSVNERIPAELGSVQYITHRCIAMILMREGAGTFLFGFDIEDAFRHIPLHPGDWQYFVMEWRGVYYVDTRVGFGSSTGPAHYDCLGRALVAIMAHQGIDLMRMVDDHLGVAKTRELATEREAKSHALLDLLGLPRAVHKDVHPTQVADFTGVRWDTAQMLASIPEEKWSFMVAEVTELAERSMATLGSLRSVVGRLMNVVTVLPRGKAHLQACYDLIAQWSETLPSRARDQQALQLPAEVVCELKWWQARLGASHAASPARPIAHVVTGQTCELDPTLPEIICPCDASKLALGAVCSPKWAVHKIPPGSLHVGLSGEVGSTYIELCAMLLACLTFGRAWRGRHVRLLSDNSGAVHIWQRKHSRHAALADIVRHMEWLAHEGGYWLEASWVAGETNVLADAVSRLRFQAFRQLAPEADHHPTQCQEDPLQRWARWL